MLTLHKFISLAAGLLVSLSGSIAQSQTGHITVNITPSSISLTAGQSANFEASVRGTNIGGVIWSVMPAVGEFTVTSATSTMDATSSTPISTVDATYKAPATIASPQAITLVATSLADPTETASATIFLGSAVGIALTPSTVSLSPGQSAVFSASIGGTLNTSVSWSLNPSVGTITNGVYTAPMVIETLQTIILTVASLADPSKTAQATINLWGGDRISVNVRPTQITLQPSQSQQFAATVEGGKSNVTWTLNPMVGAISPSGLYTPPSTVTEGQVVAVTATLSIDPTESATAYVTLAAPTPPPPLPPIQLPVEMIGLDGMTSTVSFNIPQGANLNGPIKLWMQIHGLSYQTQASVQLNNSGWTPINNSTVTVLGNGAAYGGIGGGFATLQMTMLVPLSAVNPGANTLSFRFNGTDGRVSGFRVLNFNLLAGDGSSILPAAAFVWDDPNTWQAPSTLSSDIAAGQSLWHNASLTVPTPTGHPPILAHCADCHAQDGRDLKYFNYSNNSIRTRSMFHGLTAQQGDQIASYIRSLNVPNPGRPWNPPYQPGPGLDSQPVQNWSAGAGLNAVLDNDGEMLNAMFPNGFQDSIFSASGNLNVRETPIALQLLDWNQWLPSIHPMDAYGTTFTASSYASLFQTIRSQLTAGGAAAYPGQAVNLNQWVQDKQNLMIQIIKQNTPPAPGTFYTPANSNALYSLALWGMVKSWEINQEFGLEGLSQNIFGPQADPRAWYNKLPFLTSPAIMGIPAGAGIRNGLQSTVGYLGFMWYETQLILDNSNKQQSGSSPIDFGYAFGIVNSMAQYVQPQAALQTEWLIKSMQVCQNGKGPDVFEGWAPYADFTKILIHDSAPLWQGVPTATRTAISQGLLKAWLAQVSQFTPQQFYNGGWASPTVNPVPAVEGSIGTPTLADNVWWEIPQFAFRGVDPTLISQVANWAQTLWPNVNWQATTTATCHIINVTVVVCSTD